VPCSAILVVEVENAFFCWIKNEAAGLATALDEINGAAREATLKEEANGADMIAGGAVYAGREEFTVHGTC